MSCARLTAVIVGVVLPAIGWLGCQSYVAPVPPPAERPTVNPAKRESPPKQITSAGPQTVEWEQLDLGMEPDSVYESWMLTTRVKALEGQHVRITGFMSGAIFQRDNIRTFPLMRERECPFGPGGQAHHVIEVELQGKRRTSFSTEPVTVEGVFSVRPWTGPNGKTWSLYHISADKIE